MPNPTIEETPYMNYTTENVEKRKTRICHVYIKRSIDSDWQIADFSSYHGAQGKQNQSIQ